MKLTSPMLTLSAALALHAVVLAALGRPAAPVVPPQAPSIAYVSLSPSPAAADRPAAAPASAAPKRDTAKPKPRPPPELAKTAPAAKQTPKPAPRQTATTAPSAASQPAAAESATSSGSAERHDAASTAGSQSGSGQDSAREVAPSFNAAYLSNPKPVYPALSRERQEEGTVMLKVMVEASGQASAVALHRSSGFPRLDRAAQDAVQRWRFVPARRGDTAVAGHVIVPINFNLTKG